MAVLKQKYFILLLIALFLGVSAFMAFDFAPVLTAGGRPASYREVKKLYGGLKAFDGISQNNPTEDSELKRLALNEIVGGIILDELIEETNPELQDRANELLGAAFEAAQNPPLEEAGKGLYGLSAADFKKLILLPQAKRDALTEHFESDPERLEELWNALLNTADVKIYFPGFYWEGGEVKIK